MARDFPKPWCALCAHRSSCERDGARPDYPTCRAALRGQPPELAGGLLQWAARFHDVHDPRLDALFPLLVEQLRRDGEQYSEIFEPSFSFNEQGWSMLRFSYAFPGYRAEPATVAASIEALLAPFGAGLNESLAPILRALPQPCVEQPLIGLAYDDGSRWRLKFYLQFRDGSRNAALRLGAALIGSESLDEVANGAALHLLGLDLGESGLTGAKLYFLHSELTPASAAEAFGPVQALEQLATSGKRSFRNVLRIHRATDPGGAGLESPAAIDFALAENDLLAEDLFGLDALRHLGEADTPFAQLSGEFATALRRISLPLRPPEAINGYYVLTETPPSGKSA